jgi:hypothetical protein
MIGGKRRFDAAFGEESDDAVSMLSRGRKRNLRR